MAANLIVLFKDSLMGVPAGLRYKILANDQVIDNAVIPTNIDKALSYGFYDKNNSQVTVKANATNATVTIPKSLLYIIQIQLLDQTGKLEMLLGIHTLMDGTQLTIIAISPWTKVPLKARSNEKLEGNFFEVEYNIKRRNNTIRRCNIHIRDIPRKILLAALKHRGSTVWAGDVEKKAIHQDKWFSVTFDAGTNKCNVFVSDVLTEIGMNKGNKWLPHGRLSRESPPTAGEWTNSSKLNDYWPVVTKPQPGDIGSYAMNYSDATGHVGFILTNGVTVSAGWDKIEVNDSGFRNKNGTARQDDHDFTTFRRYSKRSIQ